MDRQRIINLLAAIAAITVFGFTFGLMFPLLSLIMESRGIPSQWIGINSAMHPVGIVLSIFAIPYVVRRFGAKRAVIGSGLLTAAVIISYPLFPVFWWWFGLRLLQGFFVSILFAISEAWIVRFAEGPWRTRILAIYTSIFALSFGFGPAIISFTGIGNITIQDQAVTESMGPITDHDWEHLAPTDQMIARTRRRLLLAARAYRDSGELPPGASDPDTFMGARAGSFLFAPDAPLEQAYQAQLEKAVRWTAQPEERA